MKSLFEQFRLKRKQGMTSAEDSYGRKLEHILLRECDRTVKYRFTSSAMAMLSHLHQSRLVVPMPTTVQPIWIEFSHPLTLDSHINGIALPPVDAVYYSEHYPKSARHLSSSPQIEQYIQQTQDMYNLELLNIQTQSVFALWHDTVKHSFSFAMPHSCPIGECEERKITYLQGLASRDLTPCQYCLIASQTFQRLFALALAMIRGDFTENVEQKPATQRERVLRKEKAQGKKPRIYTVEQVYHIIEFDASVKPVAVSSHEQKEPTSSWLEEALAINPDSIIYVVKSIAQTQRHLKLYDAFGNRTRWKSEQVVTVKGHDKHVPMKTGTLTIVKASKYTKVMSS